MSDHSTSNYAKSNLIILLTHCNTKEKLNILQKNVKLLKNHKFDILLTSYLTLPARIVKSVDYFLFVKNNPILNWPVNSYVIWKTLDHNEGEIQLSAFTPDIGNAALTQMINTGNLAVTLDYTQYSFINYDLNITEEVLDTLNNPRPVLFSSEGENQRFPSFLFNSFDKPNLKKLLSIISSEDYIRGFYNIGIEFDTIETYWKHIINMFNYEKLPYNLQDKISSVPWHILNLNKDNDLFKLFYQSNFNQFNYTDTEIHTNPPCIVLYDIQEIFELIINESTFKITKSIVIIENINITKFGYYKDNAYIDLMDIFKTPILSKISFK